MTSPVSGTPRALEQSQNNPPLFPSALMKPTPRSDFVPCAPSQYNEPNQTGFRRRLGKTAGFLGNCACVAAGLVEAGPAYAEAAAGRPGSATPATGHAVSWRRRKNGLLRFWLLCCGAPLVITPSARASAVGDITAVCSRVSDDYIRAKLPNGSFEVETYAFGEGGLWGGPMSDPSIDNLKFIDVARTVAVPLAGQNYQPARDPNTTRLLIMVYWGTTAGTVESPKTIDPKHDPEEMMMFREQLDRDDFQNALLLGYDAAGVIGTDYGRHLLLTALRRKTADLMDEIEDNRYFVVLMAYDFQLTWKQKKHKLLWETRFSIRQRHNDFDKVLAPMTQYASRYFGQDSHGLVRKPLPEGQVKLGEVKVIEIVPGK